MTTERTMAAPRLVGVAELAAALGVAESWVYNKSKVGAIPTIHVGRYLRFDVREVVRHLAAEREASRIAQGE